MSFRYFCIASCNNNAVKHQKVPLYYFHDCLKNFILLFMSLLTAQVVRNSHVEAKIYFIFSRNILKQTWNSFNTKIQPQQKDRNSSYQVRQILALFYNLVALILGWNYVKGLRVTKIVKQIKFERVWGELAAKLCFRRQSFKKYLRQTLVFMWNSALRGKFSCYFSVVFG